MLMATVMLIRSLEIFHTSCKKKETTIPAELSPHWMLLSYKKPVMVSSLLAEHPAANAVDEDIRTYWSAVPGNNNEWISIDLQKNVQSMLYN